MADYQSANMNLSRQSIAGRREFSYEDTGPVGDVQEVPGFVTDANEKGMKVGDWVIYTDTSRKLVYGLPVTAVQDTGDTQGTLGLGVLIGDTS